MDASGTGHVFILQTSEIPHLSLWFSVPEASLGRFCMSCRRQHLSVVLTALGNTLLPLAKSRKAGQALWEGRPG